ncbi:MAG: trypsin-like serine protease [Planctomycetota bacterium]
MTSTAGAGVIRDDVPDSQYTGLAAAPEYESVGRLTWNETSGSFLGSGTLIADDWVLTAAHNLDGADGAGSGVSNVTFNLGGANYGIDQFILEPTWVSLGGDTVQSNFTSGWDLALVKLSEPVVGIDPAVLYTGEGELGLVGTAVGYGATGTGSTGFDAATAGTKRAGDNVIDVVGTTKTPGSARFLFNVNNERVLGVDFDEPGNPAAGRLGSDTPLDLEYLIAPGDSGGGLFVEADGQTLLAGVTSFGQSFDADGVNSDYGDLGGFTRVSPFVEWIEETIFLVDGGPPHDAVVSTFPGDFNGDGLVDDGDYAVWLAEFGQAGDSLTADANGDGVVDGGDYTVWRDHIGVDYDDVIAVFAVPEPSVAVWIILAVCFPARGRTRPSHTHASLSHP